MSDFANLAKDAPVGSLDAFFGLHVLARGVAQVQWFGNLDRQAILFQVRPSLTPTALQNHLWGTLRGPIVVRDSGAPSLVRYHKFDGRRWFAWILERVRA